MEVNIKAPQRKLYKCVRVCVCVCVCVCVWTCISYIIGIQICLHSTLWGLALLMGTKHKSPSRFWVGMVRVRVRLVVRREVVVVM